MKGIIGLGNPLIDIIMDGDEKTLSKFNLTKGRSHGIQTSLIYEVMQDTNYKIYAGDSTANAIATVALNAKGKFPVSYIGKIGKDRDGQFYTEELEKHGVIPFLIQTSKPTGMCLAIITDDSERTFAVDLGASITLTKGDIIKHKLIQTIKEHDIFHFTGYQLADPTLQETILYILEQLDGETEISFDCGDPFVVENHKDLIINILKKCSIVFANKEEAVGLFEEKSAQELCEELHEHVPIAIVKDGKKGSYIHDGELHSIEPFTVTAVDTTGAGDVYAGSFLYAYITSMSTPDAGKLASRLSAQVVTKKGGRLDELPR